MDSQLAEFVRVVHRRNVRETVAGLVVLPVFAAWLYRQPGPDLAALGKAIVILGVFLVLAVTWGKMHIPGSELADYPPAQHPDRWRSHMTTQSRFLRWAWLWYVLPLLGGAGLAALDPGRTPALGSLVMIGALVVFAVGLSWLNMEAARGIERQRDEFFRVPGHV